MNTTTRNETTTNKDSLDVCAGLPLEAMSWTA